MMTFTPLEALGLASFFAVFGGTAVKIWFDRKDRDKDCVSHEELDELRDSLLKNCAAQQSSCGIPSLNTKIDYLHEMVLLICEKLQISVKEQLAIKRGLSDPAARRQLP